MILLSNNYIEDIIIFKIFFSVLFFSFHIRNNKKMFFDSYRADSFINLLNKKVDD
jgi:hypothetical protein